MITELLLDYVRQQLSTGVSREDIKKALLALGWSEPDINEAFSAAAAPASAIKTPEIVVSRPEPAAPQTKTVVVDTPAPKKSNWVLFSIVIVLLVVLAVGVVFVLSNIQFLTNFQL